MNQLTGANLVIFIFSFNKILSGMDILKNDVIAILSEKVNSISTRNGRSSTFQPGPDKQYKKFLNFPKQGTLLKLQFWKKFIRKSEVISLKTSGKRLPGKKLAIYVGVVIAVLVLAYNLTKDLSFILVSDKEGVFNSFCTVAWTYSLWVTICDPGIKKFSFNSSAFMKYISIP